MTIFAYMDKHPLMSQGNIARHFRSKQDGALIFTQSTLSQKVKAHPELEKRAASYPNALSSKRPWVVTCPDVERALVLWVHHMEERGEVVNGPMLWEKHTKFKEQFDVPETERLLGDGWIAPFCKAHGYKECCRHGEAGSADLEAVEAERKRVALTLKTYAP
jgi:Tc5 transposase DNA-binding domain